MRRWEAFHLAAQVEAAETPYRPRTIGPRGPRDEGHEVVVEDIRSGARFRLRSAGEWREWIGLASSARSPSASAAREGTSRYAATSSPSMSAWRRGWT